MFSGFRSLQVPPRPPPVPPRPTFPAQRVSEWPFKAVVDSVWRSPTEVLTYIFCSLIGLALAIW